MSNIAFLLVQRNFLKIVTFEQKEMHFVLMTDNSDFCIDVQIMVLFTLQKHDFYAKKALDHDP